MRLTLPRLLSLALTAGTLASCTPRGSTPLSTADADSIRSASRAYAQAASDTAWSRWASFFTADAAFLPPNTSTQSGRAAIEAWGRSFPPFTGLTLEPVEVTGQGDLAYVWGRYHLVVNLPGAAPAPDSGKYIEIWRKQTDGSWKITRDIYNSDAPVPAAPAVTTGRR